MVLVFYIQKLELDQLKNIHLLYVLLLMEKLLVYFLHYFFFFEKNSYFFFKGVQATVSGSNKFGDSAQKNLIDLGFWKVTKNVTKTWHMDVSFRAPEAICNAKAQNTELIGDRVVINQNTIKHSIPLTSTQAVNENWTRGSCITVSLLFFLNFFYFNFHLY